MEAGPDRYILLTPASAAPKGAGDVTNLQVSHRNEGAAGTLPVDYPLLDKSGWQRGHQ